MADISIAQLQNKLPGSSAAFPYSEGGTTYQATLNQIIPTGVIMMWSGALASVPSGWALCDGNNGTPNLTDKFIVGAGSNYAVGAQGGANSVTLTEAQMPTHNHSVYHHAGWQGPGANTPGAGGGDTNTYVIAGVTSSSGSSQSHENRPPYFALAYIIKL